VEFENPFVIIVIYLTTAVVMVPISKRLGLGSILGYLFAGLLIGPQLLGFIHNPAEILHFAEVGVILMLFVIGLELSPDKLWEMREKIVFLGFGQLFVSGAILAVLLGLYFQTSWGSNLVIGMALALSSTAFALQLMNERGLMPTPLGRQGFAILLFQDLAVIPILMAVSLIAGASVGEQPWWVSVGALAALILVGFYLINPVLNLIARYGSYETMTAAALLIVLGSALLMESIGLSTGLGAFVAGILLANSHFRHQLEADIEPFKGLLLGLFFIAIGMNINLELLVTQTMVVVLITFALIIIKTAVITALIRLSGQSLVDSVKLGLIMCQGGEFAFVVLNTAVEGAVITATTSELLTLSVGLSMALTTPLILLFEALTRKGKSVPADYDKPISTDQPEVMIVGFGRFGQITGRILAAKGIPFVAIDKDSKHIDFVRRFGSKVYFGDATRLDLLESAGLKYVRVLMLTVNDPEEAYSIFCNVKERYPDIKVVARARERFAALELRSRGADFVHRETYDSAIQAAVSTLMAMGFTDGQAARIGSVFRKHDTALLSASVEHKDDHKKMVALSVQGRQELADIFDQDHNAGV